MQAPPSTSLMESHVTNDYSIMSQESRLRRLIFYNHLNSCQCPLFKGGLFCSVVSITLADCGDNTAPQRGDKRSSDS